jgi:glycerophosphoryl diester phosphodiesterase
VIDGNRIVSRVIDVNEGIVNIEALSAELNEIDFQSDCDTSIIRVSDTFQIDASGIRKNCDFSLIYTSTLPLTHVVSIDSVGTGGFITGNKISAQHGSKLVIPFHLSTGYQASITGCSGTQNSESYITGAVIKDCKITAKFSPSTPANNTVAISHGKGGNVSPVSATLNDNEQLSVNVQPSHGLKPKVNVSTECGKFHIGEDYTIQLSSVKGSCKLDIDFEPINPAYHIVHVSNVSDQQPLNISLSYGTFSNVPVYDFTAVPSGELLRFSINSNVNSQIASASGCGLSILDDLLQLTVPPLNDDCTITMETENSSQRYVNVSIEVAPEEYGELPVEKIKVFLGTSLNLEVDTHPDYSVTSGLGCDGITIHPLQESATIVTTKPINKPCKIQLYLSKNIYQKATPMPLIAHAGGGYNSNVYLNSIEALTENYLLGHRFFELDFSFTSDAKLVAIHDWDDTYARLFKRAIRSEKPDYDTFMSLEMIDDQTQISLERLNKWMDDHPLAYIVTDIKGGNLKGLKQIKEYLGDNYSRVIPQMYHLVEYKSLRRIGSQNIIYTLHSTKSSKEELIDSLNEYKFFAITTNTQKQDYLEIIKGANEAGVYVYLHTYNSVDDLDSLKLIGVDGLYTDHLYINSLGEIIKK